MENNGENSRTPGKFKYQSLYNWIVERILDGTFPYNAKLPSEAQLCQQFGISRQTVRNALRALNGDGYIASAKGSGSYVKKLVSPRKKKIGVLFTTVRGYICADILNGLESVFTPLGYSIQLELSHNRVSNERRFLKAMCESTVSGVIIEASKSNFPSPNAALFRQLKALDIPCVFVNSFYRNVPCSAVVWNDEEVAYALTSQLIRGGHRKIGGIFRFDEMQGALRHQGFSRALLDNDLEVNEDIVCWYSDSDGYAESTRRQSEMIDDYTENLIHNCTALVCYNDIIASTVINRLRVRGVLIPEQLTIVSFDNSDLVKLFGLKDFYSFNHPKDRIGEAAARLLLQYINRTRTDPEILTVPTPVEDSQFLAQSVPPLRVPAPSEPGEGPVPPKNP